MEDLEQIGLRLKGLRDAMGMSPEDFASSCGIPLKDYLSYEKGEKEITIRVLKSIGEKYNVDLNTLMLGSEPRMSTYSMTRKDNGLVVSRVEDYEYHSLTSGFMNRKADVFVVTAEPKPDDLPIHESVHEGQEFTAVIEGRLLVRINGKDLILEKGDSLYFNSGLPHGMKALDGKQAKFLAVIL